MVQLLTFKYKEKGDPLFNFPELSKSPFFPSKPNKNKAETQEVGVAKLEHANVSLKAEENKVEHGLVVETQELTQELKDDSGLNSGAENHKDEDIEIEQAYYYLNYRL